MVSNEMFLLTPWGELSITHPRVHDITPDRVAHALGGICRWTGHPHRHYSVAEHSLHVASLVPPEFCRHALLHDASEWLLGDVATPLKRLLTEYQRLEDKHRAALSVRFGLDLVDLPVPVLQADKAMARLEALDAVLAPMDAVDRIWPLQQPSISLQFWNRDRACQRWLEAFSHASL